MKDKEMIEEMARIIDDRLIEASGVIGSMNNGKGYWIAQKLVKHYQPKLPEDSVVLTREEYNALLLEQTRLKEIVDRIPCGYALKEETRNETAEKIYKLADEIATGSQNDGVNIMCAIKQEFGL